MNALQPMKTLEQQLLVDVRKKQWLEKNQEAVNGYKQYIEAHGVFGEKHEMSCWNGDDETNK